MPSEAQLVFEILARFKDEASRGVTDMTQVIVNARKQIAEVAKDTGEAAKGATEEVKALAAPTKELGDALTRTADAKRRTREESTQLGRQVEVTSSQMNRMVREVRGLAAPLLNELAPGLGQVASQLTQVTRFASGFSAGTAVMVGGIGAVVVGLAAYAQNVNQAAKEQAALNLAMRSLDIAGLRSALAQATLETEKWAERQKSLVGDVMNRVELTWIALQKVLGSPIKFPWEQLEEAKARFQKIFVDIELPKLQAEEAQKFVQVYGQIAGMAAERAQTEKEIAVAYQAQWAIQQRQLQLAQQIAEAEIKRQIEAAKTGNQPAVVAELERQLRTINDLYRDQRTLAENQIRRQAEQAILQLYQEQQQHLERQQSVEKALIQLELERLSAVSGGQESARRAMQERFDQQAKMIPLLEAEAALMRRQAAEIREGKTTAVVNFQATSAEGVAAMIAASKTVEGAWVGTFHYLEEEWTKSLLRMSQAAATLLKLPAPPTGPTAGPGYVPGRAPSAPLPTDIGRQDAARAEFEAREAAQAAGRVLYPSGVQYSTGTTGARIIPQIAPIAPIPPTPQTMLLVPTAAAGGHGGVDVAAFEREGLARAYNPQLAQLHQSMLLAGSPGQVVTSQRLYGGGEEPASFGERAGLASTWAISGVIPKAMAAVESLLHIFEAVERVAKAPAVLAKVREVEEGTAAVRGPAPASPHPFDAWMESMGWRIPPSPLRVPPTVIGAVAGGPGASSFAVGVAKIGAYLGSTALAEGATPPPPPPPPPVTTATGAPPTTAERAAARAYYGTFIAGTPERQAAVRAAQEGMITSGAIANQAAREIRQTQAGAPALSREARVDAEQLEIQAKLRDIEADRIRLMTSGTARMIADQEIVLHIAERQQALEAAGLDLQTRTTALRARDANEAVESAEDLLRIERERLVLAQEAVRERQALLAQAQDRANDPKLPDWERKQAQGRVEDLQLRVREAQVREGNAQAAVSEKIVAVETTVLGTLERQARMREEMAQLGAAFAQQQGREADRADAMISVRQSRMRDLQRQINDVQVLEEKTQARLQELAQEQDPGTENERAAERSKLAQEQAERLRLVKELMREILGIQDDQLRKLQAQLADEERLVALARTRQEIQQQSVAMLADAGRLTEGQSAMARMTIEAQGLADAQAQLVKGQEAFNAAVAAGTLKEGTTDYEKALQAVLNLELGVARLNRALFADMQREYERTDWLGGVQAGLRDIVNAGEAMGAKMRTLFTQTFSDITSTMTGSVIAALEGNKDQIGQLGQQLGKQFLTRFLNAAFETGLAAGLAPLQKQLAGMFGPGAGGGAGDTGSLFRDVRYGGTGGGTAALTPTGIAVTGVGEGIGTGILAPPGIGAGQYAYEQAALVEANTAGQLYGVAAPSVAQATQLQQAAQVRASVQAGVQPAPSALSWLWTTQPVGGAAPTPTTVGTGGQSAFAQQRAGEIGSSAYGAQSPGAIQAVPGAAVEPTGSFNVLGTAFSAAAFGLALYSAKQAPYTGASSVTYAAIGGGVTGAMLGYQVGSYFGYGYYGAAAGAVIGAAAGGLLNLSNKGAADATARRAARARSASTILEELQKATDAGIDLEAIAQTGLSSGHSVGQLMTQIARFNTSGEGAGVPWKWKPAEVSTKLLTKLGELGYGPGPPFNKDNINSIGELIAYMAPSADDKGRPTDIDKVGPVLEQLMTAMLAKRPPGIIGYDELLGIFRNGERVDSITKTTLLSASRLKEAMGKELFVLAESLRGLEDAERATILERIAAVDRDRVIQLFLTDQDPMIRFFASSYIAAHPGSDGGGAGVGGLELPGGGGLVGAVPDRRFAPPMTPEEEAEFRRNLAVAGGGDAVSAQALSDIAAAMADDPDVAAALGETGALGLASPANPTGFAISMQGPDVTISLGSKSLTITTTVPVGFVGQQVSNAFNNNAIGNILGTVANFALSFITGPIGLAVTVFNLGLGYLTGKLTGKDMGSLLNPIPARIKYFGPRLAEPGRVPGPGPRGGGADEAGEAPAPSTSGPPGEPSEEGEPAGTATVGEPAVVDAPASFTTGMTLSEAPPGQVGLSGTATPGPDTTTDTGITAGDEGGEGEGDDGTGDGVGSAGEGPSGGEAGGPGDGAGPQGGSSGGTGSAGTGSAGGGVGDGDGFAEGGWVPGDPAEGDVVPATVGEFPSFDEWRRAFVSLAPTTELAEQHTRAVYQGLRERATGIRLKGREFVVNPESARMHPRELEAINRRREADYPRLRITIADLTDAEVIELGMRLAKVDAKHQYRWFSQNYESPVTPAWSL